MRGLLRAPFPWFGGKSRASALVWAAFGDVANYVEPFAGSIAVLLGRPTKPKTETVNDIDAYLSNFWRALAADPEGVAAHADWPVNEADLHARHRWLVAHVDFRERMRTDPHHYDVKIAGWWVWGISAWIGGGWCATATAPNDKGEVPRRRPHLDDGRGVHRQMPAIGVSAPGNGSGMKGVHRASLAPDVWEWEQRPQLSTTGQGVHRLPERIPDVGSTSEVGHGRTSRRGVHKLALGGNGHGVGVHSSRRLALVEELQRLAARLRGVRVCCGDWKRVLTPTVTTGHGLTGVLLDPPYSHAERAGNLYACESDVSGAVREWAVEHGENPLMRIVLCGYEGEHEMPASWRVREWTAGGGFGRAKRGAANRHRERLFLSPHCLSGQGALFDSPELPRGEPCA